MTRKSQSGSGRVLPIRVTDRIHLDSTQNSLSAEPGKRTLSGAYRQPWSIYNQTQTNELEHFTRMLWHLCLTEDEPIQQRGQPRIDFHCMLFLMVYGTYFSQMSKRRLVSQLKIAQEFLGIPKIPHFNSIYNYLRNPLMTPYLRRMLVISSLPLVDLETHFLADSSGFSTGKFKEWKKVKYGNNEQWREWVKLHAMCGVQTKIITAAEVTTEYQHDSPLFEPLLRQTREYFNVKIVSADKAYSSYKNIELTVSSGALALIKFKDNARGDTKHEAWNKMYHYFNLHEEEFLCGYHKRSNVESLFSAMKEKFGERLRSKTFDGQINELLCKAISHNLCILVRTMFEFKIEPTAFFPLTRDDEVF